MASGSSEPFAKIFHEAFGDVIAAGIGLNAPLAGAGDPWIIGDGTAALDPSLQRGLKEDFTFTRLNSLFLDDHEKSRVIGNFFYRVKNASGISNRRFLELVLDVGDLSWKRASGGQATRLRYSSRRVMSTAVETPRIVP